MTIANALKMSAQTTTTKKTGRVMFYGRDNLCSLKSISKARKKTNTHAILQPNRQFKSLEGSMVNVF